MRILITNDDGIDAPGLAVLHDIAIELTGSASDVFTVAPAYEQSGVGHCMSYSNPMRIVELAEQRFAVEGSPADCVMAGLYEVMSEAKPDLILSGVNRGNNTAQNTLYSGTIGAAMEGAMHHVKSIALSQFMGPDNPKDDIFDAARAHGISLVRNLLEKAPWHADPYELFYNVNFPPMPAARVAGTRTVIQGYRDAIPFKTAPHIAPNGRKFLWVEGGPQHIPTQAGSDSQACLDGYIAVTPMRADLTAHDQIAAMQSVFAP